MPELPIPEPPRTGQSGSHRTLPELRPINRAAGYRTTSGGEPVKINWTLSDEQKAQASMQLDKWYNLSTANRSAPATRTGDDDMHVESSMLSSSPGFITQSGTPTEEEFEQIRANFGDPRANVKPEDYYAFRMIASGDGLDSYFTRQDVETSFTNFVRDLRKGQSVLGSHQMATFSYGSSFDGEVIPADETRAEYEGAFYPQWDTPELRTKNWLVGKYFIGRGVTVNNQSTDDLIRSLELGSVRKASISFMVGQYVCGIDGRDLISTMFGPMPDEECSHFPGVAYEGQIAWALMKNNTLVETSLVYKNASPSSMLLRKAEALASRGSLSPAQIEQLEGRFQVRLPRYERAIWPVVTTSASNDTTTVQLVTTGTSNSTTVSGTEESDMAGRRRGGDDTTRELAREALTAEPVPEQDDAAEAEGEERETNPDTQPEPQDQPDAGAETDADADAETDGDAAAEETTADAPETGDAAAEDGEAAEGVSESPDAAEPAVAEADASEEAEAPEATSEAATAEAPEVEATSESTEGTPETTRAEDAIEEFAYSAERLATALVRNPDAFDSGALAVAARAERAVDLALIDAGCDTTAGGYVARTFETRSRHLNEALGEPLTVEAIRRLQASATLGETLYEELVKDAVAARTSVQGESFNAPKYRDLLMAARDVAYVKEEIDSWKEAKKDRFTPGRSVVPRQPVDVHSTKDERKSLPEAPAASGAKGRGAPSMSSILEPRKK